MLTKPGGTSLISFLSSRHSLTSLNPSRQLSRVRVHRRTNTGRTGPHLPPCREPEHFHLPWDWDRIFRSLGKVLTRTWARHGRPGIAVLVTQHECRRADGQPLGLASACYCAVMIRVEAKRNARLFFLLWVGEGYMRRGGEVDMPARENTWKVEKRGGG
jgi:hypothetical protein